MADPAMAYSQDKLSFVASALRLSRSSDFETALAEMGFPDVEHNPLATMSTKEIYDAYYETGEEGLATLLRERGLGRIVPNFGISPETVKSTAAIRVKSIFENFKSLRDVLDRHEVTIHRRWLKKSLKSRRKILLEAWDTEMAVSHRPDFEALEREDEVKRWKATGYHDAFLLPYINEEDLLKPRSLLLLMSTRSRCHPSELAASEHESHRLGLGTLDPGRYLVDLMSKGDEDSYGRVYGVEMLQTHSGKIEILAARKYAQPYNALLALEAQERVLSFLVTCVKLLLHDLTEDTLLQSLPVQPDPALLLKSESEYFSLASVAAEALYQHPASLDFGRIAALLSATCDHAADHLWSLREDPGYFEAQILDSKEHREELIKDSHGKQDPVCGVGEEDRFWSLVICEHICTAYFKLELFADLLNQAERLEKLQSLYASTVSTSSDLPKPYTTAIVRFRHHFNNAAGSLGRELCIRYHASPQLRSHCRRGPEKESPLEHEEIIRVLPFKSNPIQERIHWLLARLENEDELYDMITLPTIIDELQRLIYIKPGDILTTSYLAPYVSDLAILAQCLHQLAIYQPFAQVHGKVSPSQHTELERVYEARAVSWVKIMLAFAGLDCELGRIGAPTDGRFATPVGKRRTRENVEQMRTAEKNLDDIWHRIDQEAELRSCRFVGSAVNFLRNVYSFLARRFGTLGIDQEALLGSYCEH
jgi:hypothetical protein